MSLVYAIIGAAGISIVGMNIGVPVGYIMILCFIYGFFTAMIHDKKGG